MFGDFSGHFPSDNAANVALKGFFVLFLRQTVVSGWTARSVSYRGRSRNRWSAE